MDEREGAPLMDKSRRFGGCVRLPLEVDENRLREEVETLPPSVWDTPGDRLGVHRAAGAVFLRGYAPAEGDRPILDREILDGLPYCRSLIHSLGGLPMRALLARLPGGALIPPHRDIGDYFDRTVRVHFPVVSHARVWMVCDGLTYVMAPGEAWALNNALTHAVWNAHPTRARTHLICDILPSPAAMDLLTRGEAALGRRLDHVDAEIASRSARRAVRA